MEFLALIGLLFLAYHVIKAMAFAPHKRYLEQVRTDLTRSGYPELATQLAAVLSIDGPESARVWEEIIKARSAGVSPEVFAAGLIVSRDDSDSEDS